MCFILAIMVKVWPERTPSALMALHLQEYSKIMKLAQRNGSSLISCMVQWHAVAVRKNLCRKEN